MEAVAHPQAASFRRWRIVIGLLIVTAVLVVLAAAIWLFTGPPVQGGLQLGTAMDASGLELYVGDRLVGESQAFVPWQQIMGWDGQAPLGIVLSQDAPLVSQDQRQITSLPEAHAALLAGEGASVVSMKGGNPMWTRLDGRHEFVKKEILLRHADGALDQVFCLDSRLTDLSGRTYRVLVPIRVRAKSGEALYFTSEARSSGTGRFANFFHRVTPEWNFEVAESPGPFADEINRKGFWTPTK